MGYSPFCAPGTTSQSGFIYLLQDFWVSLRKGLGHVTVDACVARALGTGTVEGQTNDKADR